MKKILFTLFSLSSVLSMMAQPHLSWIRHGSISESTISGNFLIATDKSGNIYTAELLKAPLILIPDQGFIS